MIPIKLTAFFYVAGIPEAEEKRPDGVTGAAERDNFRRRTPPVKMKYIYGELRKGLRIGTINGD